MDSCPTCSVVHAALPDHDLSIITNSGAELLRRAVQIALGVAAAALLGGLAVDVANPPKTNTINASYAFDVTGPNQVAGFADYVFVGRVLDGGSTLEWQEGIYTDFRISVLPAPIKGRVPAEVVVRQLGGTLGEDTWVLEDQPAGRLALIWLRPWQR